MNKINYKFNTNIFKLSNCKNLDELKNEWILIYYKSNNISQCLCNRNIMNTYYFFNKLNFNIITIGGGCKDIIKKGLRDKNNNDKINNNHNKHNKHNNKSNDINDLDVYMFNNWIKLLNLGDDIFINILFDIYNINDLKNTK